MNLLPLRSPGRARAVVAVACSLAITSFSSSGCPEDGIAFPTPAEIAAAYGGSACETVGSSCRERQRGCLVSAAGTPECQLCPQGYAPTGTDGACTALGGVRWHNQFASWDLAPGEEIGSLCQSWVLDNDEPLYVNAVEFENTGFYHHSNWFHVPENWNNYGTEPWVNCYDEGFDEISAALAGGVLFAQSTQTQRELQKFRTGAVIRIPPRSRIITVTHLLNYSPNAVTTDMSLAFYAQPADSFDTLLTPFQLIYKPLAIPPKATSMFESGCNLRDAYEKLFPGESFDMKLHYLLPHYHALGSEFQVEILGGPNDGQQLIDLGSFTTDPYGRLYDPPVDLSNADGLTFRCGFANPTDEEVGWGIGDQEMCEGLGFVESKMAFAAGPGTNSVRGDVLGDGVIWNDGECFVAGFEFSQDK